MPLPTSPPWDYPRACGAYGTAFDDGGYTVNQDKRLKQEAQKAVEEEQKRNDDLQVEKDRLTNELLRSGMSRQEAQSTVDLLAASAMIANPENPAAALNVSYQNGAVGVNDLNQESNIKARTKDMGATARQNLSADAEHWGRVIEAFRKNLLDKTITHKIMDTPLVMTLIRKNSGISIAPGTPLGASVKVINKILVDKHSLEIDDETFKSLPYEVADPVMILINRDDKHNLIPNEVIIVTELEDKNKKRVIAPFRLIKNTEGNYQLKTFFGRKNGEQSLTWLQQRLAYNDLLYADKKKNYSAGRGCQTTIVNSTISE